MYSVLNHLEIDRNIAPIGFIGSIGFIVLGGLLRGPKQAE
jgi:hypothetical protein